MQLASNSSSFLNLLPNLMTYFVKIKGAETLILNVTSSTRIQNTVIALVFGLTLRNWVTSKYT
jgi:hypothetical protein